MSVVDFGTSAGTRSETAEHPCGSSVAQTIGKLGSLQARFLLSDILIYVSMCTTG